MKSIIRMTFALSLVAALGSVAVAQCASPNVNDLNEKYRPRLYAELPDDMYGPDAQYYDAETKTLYLSVPNFLDSDDPALPVTSSFIVKVNPDGTVEKLYEFPIYEGEVKIGAMGIEKGPDGNLYVCDNQYFFDPNYTSRVFRLKMKDGKPYGDPELVVKGLKVANAIMFSEGFVYVTDTILDEPNKYGSGGIWQFKEEDILKAGTSDKYPAIDATRKDGKLDPRLIVVEDAVDIRGNNCGADGICRDSKGVFYFGNYGDGAFYRFRIDAKGKPGKVEKLFVAGEPMRSVDGICYDAKTNKVYITDSARNAIWAVSCVPWGQKPAIERIWENEDTNGADGALDLPCECRIIDGKLIITNQDCPVGDTGKCQATDKPYSLSVIDLY